MTTAELHALLSPAVQALLSEHTADDPAEFAMRFHGSKELPVRAMAEQLSCRRKAAKKLPKRSTNNLLYTPLALEQASSERMAAYKRQLLSGQRLLDMSGGLGIDAMALSAVFQEVMYCERDELLCEIVAHNLARCGITNIAINHGDSVQLLERLPDDAFDWMYVDPARREEGRRSISLEAASPNVIELHDLLLAKVPHVCIKASPALEISRLKEHLPSLKQVMVVSLDGECKEILLLLHRGCGADDPVTVKAVCLTSNSAEVVEIIGGNIPEKVVASSLKTYLYEPDAAIIKARLSATLAAQHELEFVNQTVDYLTSEQLVHAFPGRIFRVVDVFPYKQKSFKKLLNQHNMTAASIQRRDFPLSVETLRSMYRLRESDRVFLFFTKNAVGQHICISTVRVLAGDEAMPVVPSQSANPEC